MDLVGLDAMKIWDMYILEKLMNLNVDFVIYHLYKFSTENFSSCLNIELVGKICAVRYNLAICIIWKFVSFSIGCNGFPFLAKIA